MVAANRHAGVRGRSVVNAAAGGADVRRDWPSRRIRMSGRLQINRFSRCRSGLVGGIVGVLGIRGQESVLFPAPDPYPQYDIKQGA